MSSHDEFWGRVNERLDARLDALEDDQIQRELERSPDLLDELQTLRDALHTLTQRRRPWRRVVSIAATVAAVVALTWRRNALAPRAVDAPFGTPLAAPLALAPRFAPIPRSALLELRATYTLSSSSADRVEHIDLLESRSSVERRQFSPQGQFTLIALAHHQPSSRQP